MSILINDSDRFDITVRYGENNGNIEIFPEEGEIPQDAHSETFTFKRPNWAESRTMLSSCVIMNAANGEGVMDPYRFMDTRIKTLLKDWTLKDKDGNKIEVNPANIDMLPPTIVDCLFNRLTKKLTPQE